MKTITLPKSSIILRRDGTGTVYILADREGMIVATAGPRPDILPPGAWAASVHNIAFTRGTREGCNDWGRRSAGEHLEGT